MPNPSPQRLFPYLAVLVSVAVVVVVQADDDANGVAVAQPYPGPPIGSIYTPSELIFPPQELPMRFFHGKHVDDAGMDCVDCHSLATQSIRSSDDLLPEMEICLDCHFIEDGADAYPPANCSACHLSFTAENPPQFEEGIEIGPDTFRQVKNWPELPFIPAPNIHFPHKIHIDNAIECATCHTDMLNVDLASRLNLPTMSLCLTCHTGHDDEPSDTCNTCHLSYPDGRLLGELPTQGQPRSMVEANARPARVAARQERKPGFDLFPSTDKLIPTGRFRPDDHRLDFLNKHRDVAAADAAYCNTCHTEAWCEDCHNNTLKPIAIHPANYAQLHAIDAMNDSAECNSCHTRQDFCITCHEQTGVTTGNPLNPNGLNFHPEGWVDLTFPQNIGISRERSLHAAAAQRNISACASCHTEETCMECHSNQGDLFYTVPVKPHPDGWLEDGRCGEAQRRNSHVCLKCHDVADPKLNDPRCR